MGLMCARRNITERRLMLAFTALRTTLLWKIYFERAALLFSRRSSSHYNMQHCREELLLCRKKQARHNLGLKSSLLHPTVRTKCVNPHDRQPSKKKTFQKKERICIMQVRTTCTYFAISVPPFWTQGGFPNSVPAFMGEEKSKSI